MNVSVTTAPWPETPPAPGGRAAVTCKVPVEGSSRCTRATACPSCDRNPPLETLTTCNWLTSYVSCKGTEYIFCPPETMTFTVNVAPFACVVAGGSNRNAPPVPDAWSAGGCVVAGAGATAGGGVAGCV